jgi:hypothetical protein
LLFFIILTFIVLEKTKKRKVTKEDTREDAREEKNNEAKEDL